MDRGATGDPPDAATRIFGVEVGRARRYATLLATTGVARGLVGPQEGSRLWERHILNCAVLGELIPPRCRVVDVGSGAGLPGIPLALARPDLTVTLVEPMARRVTWLEDVLAELDLAVTVVRGRAEEPGVRSALGGTDVVTARAVASLGQLADWTLPLLRVGGQLLAIKGDRSVSEMERDRTRVTAAGGSDPRLAECGMGMLDTPTRVVCVTRVRSRRVKGR